MEDQLKNRQGLLELFEKYLYVYVFFQLFNTKQTFFKQLETEKWNDILQDGEFSSVLILGLSV